MKTKDILKKAKKIEKSINLIASLAVFTYMVYTLIPKSEKITGINPDGFVNK